MKIGSIQSFYGYNKNLHKNNHNKTHSTAFKADVRYLQTSFLECDMPKEHFERVNELLTYSKDGFKDKGSDNILIILRPFTNGEKKQSKITTDIEMFTCYKDTERARREILEYRKNDPELRDTEETKLLEERDPLVMNALKIPYYSKYIMSKAEEEKFKIPTLEMLKDQVEYTIECMEKEVEKTSDDTIIKEIVKNNINPIHIPIP